MENNMIIKLEDILPLKLEKINGSYAQDNNFPIISDDYLFNLLNETIGAVTGENILVSDIDLDKYLKYKNGKISSMLIGMECHEGFKQINIKYITNMIIGTIKNNSLMNISNYFQNSINLVSREISSIQSYFDFTEIAMINTYIEYIRELMEDIQSNELSAIMLIPVLSKLQEIKTSSSSISKVNEYKLNNLIKNKHNNNSKELLECFIKIKYCSIIRIFVLMLELNLSESFTQNAVENTYKKIERIIKTIDSLNNELKMERNNNDTQIENQYNRWDAKWWIEMYYDMLNRVQNLNINNNILNHVIKEINETSNELHKKLNIETIQMVIKPINKLVLSKKINIAKRSIVIVKKKAEL
jgi:hypothetical protein